MKATKQDYDYLIDQLTNFMMYYASGESFVEQLTAETSFLHTDLEEIWRLYQIMDGKTAFDMTNYDWYDWIKTLTN